MNVAIKSFIVTKDKKVLRFIPKKLMLLIINFTQKQPGLFSRHGIYNEINCLAQTFNHLARDWDYSFLLNKKKQKIISMDVHLFTMCTLKRK